MNNGLNAVGCNVLLATHDHQMISTVANRIFDFTSDGRLIDKRMEYDDYLAWQAAQAQQAGQ